MPQRGSRSMRRAYHALTKYRIVPEGGRLGFFERQGQAHGKGRTDARLAFNHHATAMQFDDLTHQRQAQSGARRIRVLDARAALKLLEDTRQSIRANAVALFGPFA